MKQSLVRLLPIKHAPSWRSGKVRPEAVNQKHLSKTSTSWLASFPGSCPQLLTVVPDGWTKYLEISEALPHVASKNDGMGAPSMLKELDIIMYGSIKVLICSMDGPF